MASVIAAIATAVVWWHRRRYLKKHGKPGTPLAPVIASVSAYTGEVIATGEEMITDNGGLGDGNLPSVD